MDSKEVRARALDAAVRIGAAWKMESASSVVGLATVFEQYIDGSDRAHRLQGTAPIKAHLLTEEAPENIWGRPCTTCGHSTGVHLSDRGCEHPDGCECAWPDTSAPECVSCGTVHPSHHSVRLCECGHCSRQHAGSTGYGDCGAGCECTRYRQGAPVPAPEPAGTGAPRCGQCGHSVTHHSLGTTGCALALCTCCLYIAPEPTSAPECGCGHEMRRHGPEAGCVECKCIRMGSAP